MSADIVESSIDAFRDLAFVHIGQWYSEALVLLLVAAALTAAVERSRRLALTRAAAERRQANLARYFSPRVVERLAHSDQPFGEDRRQDVAVLFADIAGFTTLAEQLAPEEVMRLLRGFHARMEEIVFSHGGTLDKLIGDALRVRRSVSPIPHRTMQPGRSPVPNACWQRLPCGTASGRARDRTGSASGLASTMALWSWAISVRNARWPLRSWATP
jgi:class 3 adenylate cyclase